MYFGRDIMNKRQRKKKNYFKDSLNTLRAFWGIRNYKIVNEDLSISICQHIDPVCDMLSLYLGDKAMIDYKENFLKPYSAYLDAFPYLKNREEKNSFLIMFFELWAINCIENKTYLKF
jgi:hypothetical protein